MPYFNLKLELKEIVRSLATSELNTLIKLAQEERDVRNQPMVLNDQELQLIKEGRKIAAIKSLRARYRCDLRRAKELADKAWEQSYHSINCSCVECVPY